MFEAIAFDGDDTLWHNEILYTKAQTKFQHLLANYSSSGAIERTLYETEVHNLQCYGYGVKSFTLSMIETAVRLTGGRIPGSEIQRIIDLAKEMLSTPLQLIDMVDDTLAELARSHRLLLITKGDLFDQETKLIQSGLADLFAHVEIVSEKAKDVYGALLMKHGIPAHRFLMVGNSLRSDILPVLAAGGQAVYIPYPTTWEHEKVPDQSGEQNGYLELEHIGLLPALVDKLSSRCDRPPTRESADQTGIAVQVDHSTDSTRLVSDSPAC